MKIRVSILTAVAFSVIALAAAATPVTEQVYPRVELVSFHSAVLNATKRFSVVLPDNYDHAKSNWPALFLFHGRGRNERSLIDDENARNSLLKASFVVILPDGDDGWYIDSPVRPADKYQTYTEEVIALAGTLYNLSQDRNKRALSGWSMGGYGCTYYAEKHAHSFSVLAPIIGLLDFPRTGLPEGQSYDVPTDRFGSDPEVWATYNPINHIESLRETSILIVMADESFDRTMNQNFTNALTQADIHHSAEMLSGGHTFDVVRAALPYVINHVEKSFKPVTVLPPVAEGLTVGLDGSNVTLDEGKVRYWNNQISSSESDDFSQDTLSYRPSLLTNFTMPNGAYSEVIDFSGTNQYLTPTSTHKNRLQCRYLPQLLL